MPGLVLLRLRAFLGRSDRRPLKDSRTKVSSASTIPRSSGLVACRGAQKPMTPTKRRRRMDSAERRGLGQALALDHRARVIEPAVLLAQMRHRRLGQRIEGAPAALAAKPQKPMRAAPADDFAASAMGTPLSRHALDAGRSERVLLAPVLAALLGGSLVGPQPRSPSQAQPSPPGAGPRSSPNPRQPSRTLFQPSSICSPDPNHSNQINN